MKRVMKIVGFCSLFFLQDLCIASDYLDEENTRTLEELKQCPCVQKYISIINGEDVTTTTQKKKKKKKKKKNKVEQQQTSNFSYENYDNESSDNYGQNQKSSSRGSSRGKNKNGTKQSNKQNKSRSSSTRNRSSNSGNSWMHETAWMNSKNPFAATYAIAQNSNSSSNSNRKSVEILKNLELRAKNIKKPKYRINEKESAKFRKELEKYRQVLA